MPRRPPRSTTHAASRLLLALAVATAAARSIAAQTRSASGAVSGTVFLDRNANGVRDAGEPGAPGVRVSNQDTIVVTDGAGAFRLRDGGHGVVYVTVPDGRRAVGGFWRAAPADGSPLAFALAERAAVRDFTFVHASDTHVSEASVARLRHLRTLVDAERPAFALISGDLVKDALRVGEAEARGYYELFDGEARRFATPVYTIPGNHELFGIENEKSHVPATHPLLGRAMYRHFRGPDWYSFDFGGVHFVGLNTVDVHAGRWYHGQVDSVQLAWLRRDLAFVPPDMPVVTFNHIPFFTTAEELNGYDEGPPAPTIIDLGGRRTFRHAVANAGEVLAALRVRRHVLALGGHVHLRELLRFEIDGASVRFEQSAATVAPTSAAGMRFPSGFTVYRVRDGVIDAGRFVPLDSATAPTR